MTDKGSPNISTVDRIVLLFGVARTRPVQMSLSVVFLLISAILDGIGVLALLPAIGMFLGGTGIESDPHPVIQGFIRVFESVGIPFNLETLLGFILAVILFKVIFTLFAHIQVAVAQSQSVEQMRRDLISRLLQARWEFFTRQPTGRLSNAITNESRSFGQLYSQFADIVSTILQACAYLITALAISSQVTLGAIVVGAVMLLLLSRFIGATQRNSRRMTMLTSGFSARLIDSLMGMKPLKAMGMAAQLQPILHKDIRMLRQISVRLLLLKKALTSSQEIIRTVALVGVIYIFSAFSPTSIEALLVIAFVFMRTLETFGRFQKQWQGVVQTEVPYRHVRGLLDYARVNEERDNGDISGISLSRDIRFENVSFAYSTDDGGGADLYFRSSEGDAPVVPVIKDMNLRICAGEFVCLLGSSGAGKTTLADLLIGLILPQEGRILVDDTPLEEFSLHAWRRAIGYVPQDVFLFNGSIRDNITMGDDIYSDSEIYEAIFRAGAEEFISKLDSGLDSQVGERGVTLSGGQRQRICIARALVRRPQLLILDESTSALDSRTEQEIALTVRSLTPQVTVVAITHRPALADISDVVIHIEDGAVKSVVDVEVAGNGQVAELTGTERG
ncbi:MAG: ABC transporter ATP-binding protein [Rhodospirillaceae bacterium]|jgi:ATP-binding cassette, subfamily C, bacterial|nr:ABC transporter ATP-binding protein [Rhodospirillales bacterium]MBT4773540.1 ABC transporter ATP-binding protein [Rhodospirillaceae bacterium]MBT5358018.1 ABC transporter ATP-binding protein [Rhodospirillaceae bacterium]MBT5769259.1 ABC transporter ATP-binding protein [Rhodospirillaceae bacterium]MBT6309968.1 ABC transporter ATP-binding protein [Rhodospirillaceae bacterium]